MMKRIFRSINKPITENLTFFVFMSFTGLFCILFEPGFGHRIHAAFNLFFDLYVLCAVLVLVPARVRRYVRYALYAVFYLVALVDIVCYVRLGAPLNPLFIQLVRLTDSREATEALSSYLTADILFSKVGVLLLVIIINVLVGLRKQRQPLQLRHPVTAGVLISLFLAVCAWVSRDDITYKYYTMLLQDDHLTTIARHPLEPKAKYYVPIYRLLFSLNENIRMKDTERGLVNAVGKAKVDSCSFASPNIVLILGESCNRQHSSLYGYRLDTTPCQKSRRRRGELIPFSDVVASWNLTCQSLQNILSTRSEGDSGRWYDYPLFPTLFRNAGYRVTFISNQYVIDASQTFSDFAEDIFINNKQIDKYNYDARNTATHQYDYALLNDYRRLRNTHPHQLTIFHFMGLHGDFNFRYPPQFRHFKPADYPRSDLTEADKQILADYDNAMLYNDYVTDAIIRQFEDKDAIVVFVPDHGERVFDNSTEWGRNLSWDSNDVKQQFDIPFWIWTSETWRNNHPDTWQTIKHVKDRRYMTDAISQFLFHLAGISTPYYTPENDILSPACNENRKRLIRGERDYDDIVRN